jgi:hypothetical protein
VESVLLSVYDVLLVNVVTVATWAIKTEHDDEQLVRAQLGGGVALVVEDGKVAKDADLDVWWSNKRVKPA